MDERILEVIKPLKSLNSEQMAKCQEAAHKQVLGRIGEKPTREQFDHNVTWRSIMHPNDYAGIALFVVLLVISLTHMITFTGSLANQVYDEASSQTGGIFFSLWAWVGLHQLSFFAFSELGVLFFYIRHTMAFIRWRDAHPGFVTSHKAYQVLRRTISVSSLAAFACAVVAIIANVSSLTYNVDAVEQVLINGGIGILIPLLTLFLGERAAEILMEYVYARERAEKDWRSASEKWRAQTAAPESYDEGDGINSYRRYLGTYIVEYYKRHIAPTNKIVIEWTPEIELALAARELSRLRRLSDLDAAESFFTQPPLGGVYSSEEIASNGSPESLLVSSGG